MEFAVRNLGVISARPMIAECASAFIAEKLKVQRSLTASNVEGLVRESRGLEMSLVLVCEDIGPSSFESAASRLAQHWAFAWSVAVLRAPTASKARRAKTMGYSGCIAASSDGESILSDLRSIVSGRSQGHVGLEPRVPTSSDQRKASGRSTNVELTAREQTVLRQLALGLSSKDSARELGLVSRTVDAHRRRIQVKLGISTVAELTRYCIAEGLIDLEVDVSDARPKQMVARA